MSRNKLSGRIISLAWAIEIIAAAVGLFLAISRMIGPSGAEELPLFFSIQGALPFFAVAVIELTKIPLASVFYTAKAFRWKLIFAAALLLAMGITFETFFVGFDMYQSLLVRDLRPTLTEISEQKRIIRTVGEDRQASEQVLSGRESAAEASRQNEESINSKFDKLEGELKRQKEEVYKKYEAKTGPLQTSLETVKSDLKSLEERYQTEVKRVTDARDKATDVALEGTNQAKSRDQDSLNALRAERKSIVAAATERRKQVMDSAEPELLDCFVTCGTIRENRDNEIAKISESEQRNLAGINNQIQQLQSRLSGSGIDTSPVRDQYATELKRVRTEFNAEKRGLEKKRDHVLEQIAIASGSISGSDKRKIKDIEKQLAAGSKSRQTELAAEKKRFDSQQTAFDEQNITLSSAANVIAEANKALVPLCTTLNAKVADNQVYRLAMQLHGSDDACALTEEQLSTTKAIWFGSLAVIVSALGTILALAAFVVRDPPPPLIRSSRPLGDRLRMAMIAVRRRMNKANIRTVEVPVERVVEVVKEVPVDKVVFRDVPVEIVKREVVHVPVYSNDPSLLGKSFKATEEK
jgi:hypothetical protein